MVDVEWRRWRECQPAVKESRGESEESKQNDPIKSNAKPNNHPLPPPRSGFVQQALQGTRRERRGCNRGVPWAESLSLGRCKETMNEHGV